MLAVNTPEFGHCTYRGARSRSPLPWFRRASWHLAQERWHARLVTCTLSGARSPEAGRGIWDGGWARTGWALGVGAGARHNGGQRGSGGDGGAGDGGGERKAAATQSRRQCLRGGGDDTSAGDGEARCGRRRGQQRPAAC